MATVAEAGVPTLPCASAIARPDSESIGLSDQSAADGISTNRPRARDPWAVPDYFRTPNVRLHGAQELAGPLPGGTTRHGPQVVRVKKQ